MIIVTPVLLLAHGGHGTDFTAGITHTLFGLDHLIAIIAMAILGHGLMTEKHWLPSGAFIMAMALGGWLGIRADSLEMTEVVIMSSVLITGVLIGLQIELTLVGFTLLALGFGFFHGHAHGVEMPYESNVSLYILGFVIGAIILSLVGFAISKLIKKPIYIQLIGAFIGGMGLMMLLS